VSCFYASTTLVDRKWRPALCAISVQVVSPGAGRVTVFSAGSEPANEINPSAVAVMQEVGIDIASAQPQLWTMEMLEAVDVVVTMGCGDACPFLPGKKYVDWPLKDPAGQGVVNVRPIRDEIKKLVEDLLAQIA